MLKTAATAARPPSVRVVTAGVPSVVGVYSKREFEEIPVGFAKVCEAMRWDTQESWHKLSDRTLPWFLAENGSYMYRNIMDGQWWSKSSPPSTHSQVVLGTMLTVAFTY